MNIQQEDNGQYGSFFIENDTGRIAELSYTWRTNDVVSIDHTIVDENVENHGIGSALVERMVDFAREKNIKLKLYCTFAKAIFERKTDYHDVMFH
jgi:uncharacterized protein